MLAVLETLGIGLWWLNHPTPPSATPSTGPSANAQPMKPEDEITFAGLSGLPPKFIDAGQKKGKGWSEIETLEIRKALATEGFKIKTEYFTPSRIAHEFRINSPICTYPVEWSDPDRTFAQKPAKIYSIPLKLEGELTRSIALKAGFEDRFKKHLNSKGDLNLRSLIEDPSLKTVLVRDKDYGLVTSWTTYIDAKGDQAVRKEFQKNISLISLHDNSQLVEMLNGERFDYLFSDHIELSDLKRLGFDSSRFKYLAFARTGIHTGMDPNLILVSIACSDHPLTRKALPHINRWISMYRGLEWQHQKWNYRESQDERIGFQRNIFQTTLQKFRGILETGALDVWYPKQQSYFPSLELFPPEDQPSRPNHSPALAPAPLAEKNPRWTWVKHSPTSLAVYSSASAFFHDPYPLKKSTKRHHVFDLKLIERHLPPALLTLRKDLSHLTQEHSAPSLPELKIPLESTEAWTELTLFAFGLEPKDLVALEPVLRSGKLTTLRVLGASAPTLEKILGLVKSKVEKINLTSSVVEGTSLIDWIGSQPLVELHLTDTQLTQEQLNGLLAILPATVQELGLAYQRTAWTDTAVKTLSRLNLPKLHTLDLENDNLSDHQLQEMIRIIPKGIKSLYLGTNPFTKRSLIPLFHRLALSEIQVLDLEKSSFATLANDNIKLPRTLKALNLENTGLSAKSLPILPPSLKLRALNLSENPLGPEGIRPFLEHLETSGVNLNLRHTRLGNEGLKLLGNRHYFALNLGSNQISETGIEFFRHAAVHIESLDLPENQIGRQGVALIVGAWLKELKRINLSDNLLEAEDLLPLAKNFPNHLKELELAGQISLPIDSLAQHLPPDLQFLDLSNNQLSDLDLERLAPVLPKGLQGLDLRKSAFGVRGALALARSIPQALHTLYLRDTPLTGAGLLAILRALPSSLGIASFGYAKLSQKEAELFQSLLPKGLFEIWLWNIRSPEGDFGLVPLPKALSTLRLYDCPLSTAAMQTLAKNWPSNLREIYFEGIELSAKAARELLGKLPPTLERLALFSAGLDDNGIQTIQGKKFNQLHYYQLFSNLFTGMGLQALLGAAPYTSTLQLTGNSRLFLPNQEVPKLPLSRVRELLLTNGSYGNAAITKLIGQLSQDTQSIDLASSDIGLKGLKELLQALPANLREFFIMGNDFQSEGLSLVHDYKEAKEKRDGIPFHLVE